MFIGRAYVYCAFDIGKSFHNRSSKRLVTFFFRKTYMYIHLGKHKVLDQEGIYARVIFFLVSNTDLDLLSNVSNGCSL